MDDDLPADSIVPIAVVLDERKGYTLWAPPWEEDGEEWQAFLGTGGRIHLFTTPGQLAHFLTTDAEHDLSDHPAWEAVKQASREQLRPHEDYVFDLDGVYDLVASGPDRWSVGELADTLDMVERMAECCEVDEVEEHLTTIPGLGLLDSGHEVFVGRNGEKAWTDIAEGFGEHWEPVLEALTGALHWVEPVELDDDDDDDDDEDEDEDEADDDSVADDAADDDDADDDEDVDDVVGATALHRGALVGVGDTSPESELEATRFWESVGILPVRLRMPEGVGLTLRCYVEDSARFLGSELTVDVFQTADGLSRFIEEGEPNDLAGLATWGAVVEADAEPIPAEPDRYDLAEVSDILDGTADHWDLGALAGAAEAALDLAEYCHLARVEELLGPETELGQALAAEEDGSEGAERPDPSEVAVLAEQWNEVVAEISSCLRWHD